MEQRHKYNYLAKNTILFTISSFGSKILVFLLVPLYTSVLSTTEYGIADLITTASTLLMYIFTINIADSVLRFAIEQKKDQEIYLSYGLQVLFVGSILLGTIIVGISITNMIGWVWYYYVFLFLEYFSISLNQIITNYLRAIDDIKTVGVAGIVTTSVTIISNIVFLLGFKIGLAGFFVSIILGSIISSLYCFIKIGRSIIFISKRNVSNQVKSEMRNFSIPLIFNGIAWWMNNSIDKFFILAICGVAQNGIYAISYKIPTILIAFHSIFSQAWNLSAIKEFDKDDKDGFFSFVYTTYNSFIVILCSILLLLNIFIAKVLYNNGFYVAWKYSSVLLISTIFSCLSGLIGSIFTAVKNSKIFAISTVSTAILHSVLDILLISRIGIMGAAIASGISFFFVWLIRLISSRKFIKLNLHLGRDFLCYILLIFQVIFEHYGNKFYWIQILILIILIIINKENIITIARIIKNYFQYCNKKYYLGR